MCFNKVLCDVNFFCINGHMTFDNIHSPTDQVVLKNKYK